MGKRKRFEATLREGWYGKNAGMGGQEAGLVFSGKRAEGKGSQVDQ